MAVDLKISLSSDIVEDLEKYGLKYGWDLNTAAANLIEFEIDMMRCTGEL